MIKRGFNKLINIGVEPNDGAASTGMKRLLVYLALMMSFGGIVWGGICSYFDIIIPSLIPYGYVALSICNLIFFGISKNYKASRFIQVFISLLLPFLFQWALGGFTESGSVMLWANLALVGSLALHKGRNAYWWLAFYTLLTVVSLLIDSKVYELRPLMLDNANTAVLTSLNTILVSAIIFVIAKILLDYGRKARLEVEQKNEELISQKKIIEQKNEDITSSLNYASNIQKSILGQPKEIVSHFTDGFLLYKPKDIVSGDFYWYREIEGKKLLAIADCTGHGVPGAFMTILGHNLLDRITIGEGETSPQKILFALNKALIASVRTGFGDQRVDDGIDLLVLSVDSQENKINVAAAKTPLWYFRNNEFFEVRGSKHSLGSMGKNKDKVFEEHEIAYEPNDVFYVFSDGFQDQMGGPYRKRFLRQNFANLLQNIHKLPFNHQKENLREQLSAWKAITTKPTIL